MQSQRTSDSALSSGGKSVVRAVIQEPVKEAVHEAYAEERAKAGDDPDAAGGREDAPDDGSGGGGRLRRVLLPLAGIAGAAYLRRRLRNRASGSDDTEGPHERSRSDETETDQSDPSSSAPSGSSER